MWLKKNRLLCLPLFLCGIGGVLILTYKSFGVIKQIGPQSDLYLGDFIFYPAMILWFILLAFFLSYFTVMIFVYLLRFDVTEKGILFRLIRRYHLIEWEIIGEICICFEYTMNLEMIPIIRIVKADFLEKDMRAKHKNLPVRRVPKWLYHNYMARHPFKIIRLPYSTQLEDTLSKYFPVIHNP